MNNPTHHSSADLTITVAARGSVLSPKVTNVCCDSSSELPKSSPLPFSYGLSIWGISARKETIVKHLGVHIRSTWAWSTRVLIMPKSLTCSPCTICDEYTFFHHLHSLLPILYISKKSANSLLAIRNHVRQEPALWDWFFRNIYARLLFSDLKRRNVTFETQPSWTQQKQWENNANPNGQ